MKNYEAGFKSDFRNRVQSGPITLLSSKLRDQIQSNASKE